MQSNTVTVGNQHASFASFSVEKPKPDPFNVIDGRYVGHDGFVVPKDFAEFYDRFPSYVRNWIGRRVNRSRLRREIDDWTQDLLIHLNCLPANSKHRAFGKQDVVQTFDPQKQYGASSARFFNYINLCLGNRFATMHSARKKNPICCPDNLCLTADGANADRCQADDEFCHRHSEHLRKRFRQMKEQGDARQALAEFSEFVTRQDSSVLPAMKAIAATATSGAAAKLLGTSTEDFWRMRSRLRQLGRCFQTGERVPKQRRRYKRRLRRIGLSVR